MGKQKTIYLSGMGKWFHKIFDEDEYEGKRFWTFTLYPDEKSLALAKDLGFFKHPRKFREDEDGVYMPLKRNVLKPWKLKKGENPEFEPVKVLNEEGKPLPEDYPLIGNRTKVTAKVTIYPIQKTFGARLETIRIDELVEYIPPEEVEASESKTDSDFRPF